MLIKSHGGRITSAVSKKTVSFSVTKHSIMLMRTDFLPLTTKSSTRMSQSFLLCDEDIEGVKSKKAKELGSAHHLSILSGWPDGHETPSSEWWSTTVCHASFFLSQGPVHH